MDLNQFRLFTRPLLKWWWLIVAAAIIAAVSAYVFLQLRGPIYVTRGLVMVGSSIEELNPDSMQLAMTRGLATTYVRLAEYGSLAEATMESLGLDPLPDYEISVVPDSQLIEVSVTDADPQRAQLVASELINRLIALGPGGTSQREREDFTTDQIQKLQNGIAQAEETIIALQEELSVALSARQIRQIEERIAAQEAKLTTLRSNYVGLLQMTDQRASNTLRLVDAPTVPNKPVASHTLLLIMVAALLGACMAIGAAYLLEMLDDRLHGVAEIEEEFGLHTLGVLTESTAEQIRGPLVMQIEPHSMAAESFRVLRTNLLYASIDNDLKILHVTSPGPGDGKSYISSNLAIAAANAGKRVILVDADMRKPTIHRVFGILNNIGLSTALVSGNEGIQDAVQPTTIANLWIMTSGPLPPNPSELLTSNRMHDTLRQLSLAYDLVLVDSPPVTVVSDSAMLASRADGVLLVLSADRLGRERVRSAVNALSAVHANILGVALNRSSSNSFGFAYTYRTDYSNQYYRSHYRDETSSRSAGNIDLVPVTDQSDFVVTQDGRAVGRFELEDFEQKGTAREEAIAGS